MGKYFHKASDLSPDLLQLANLTLENYALRDVNSRKSAY